MRNSRNMNRVAFVSHTTQLTGAVMSYYTLMTGLNSCEFNCFPILPDDGPMYRQLQEDQFEPFVVPFVGLAKLTSVRKARLFLKDKDINLVYLSCTHKFCRTIGKAAKSLGIPIVWHVREPPKGNRVQKNIRYMKKFDAKVVVVSKEQQAILEPKIDIFKVDNGVDTSRFDITLSGERVREQYHIHSKHFVFGIIGSIEKRKNTENFLLAAQKISEKVKGARFLVVGSGKEDYIGKMKQIVDTSSSLSGKVIFTGNVWNIPEMMASLDVLVMPSNWEAFPRVVIEGMMMGLPVVASDVGDVSYILDHGENGLIVPPKDLEMLTEAMFFCIENPERLKLFSGKAYLKAKENFSQARHVKIMQGIFEQALQKRDS